VIVITLSDPIKSLGRDQFRRTVLFNNISIEVGNNKDPIWFLSINSFLLYTTIFLP
jgi:hypothetical protein